MPISSGRGAALRRNAKASCGIKARDPRSEPRRHQGRAHVILTLRLHQPIKRYWRAEPLLPASDGVMTHTRKTGRMRSITVGDNLRVAIVVPRRRPGGVCAAGGLCLDARVLARELRHAEVEHLGALGPPPTAVTPPPSRPVRSLPEHGERDRVARRDAAGVGDRELERQDVELARRPRRHEGR